MEELLRAPTEGYGEAIVLPEINADHFIFGNYDKGRKGKFVDAAQVSVAATTVTITTEEITLAQALEALKTSKPKVKGFVFQEQQLAKRLQAQEQEELSDVEKATLFQQLLEKDESIFKAHDRAKEITTTELVEGKEKRAGTELIQENTKKQKVDDDKETTELKQGDLDDLELSWYNAKFESTKPVENLDLLLLGDLKTMFEPYVEDAVWRNQQAYKVLDWKLYDSYGVHSLRMQHMQIYMLVEKKYPFAPLILLMMLEKKLNIDYESEMAYQLFNSS
ncbi:hypothetical protein Tco_1328327 [Tanacetum coccineum]